LILLPLLPPGAGVIPGCLFLGALGGNTPLLLPASPLALGSSGAGFAVLYSSG